MTLDELHTGQEAHITSIDWDAVPDAEGRRLRLLGIEEGARVKLLHRGILFWRDPLAVRVGRMIVALRLAHARTIHCGDAPVDEHEAARGEALPA